MHPVLTTAVSAVILALLSVTIAVPLIRSRESMFLMPAGPAPAPFPVKETVVSPGSRAPSSTKSSTGSHRKPGGLVLGKFTILNGERAGERLGLGGSGIRIGR